MTEPELIAAPGEDVFIKGKKIGERDYVRLAQFFKEDTADPALWNAVLLEAAKSEDSNMRRMVLAVTLDEPVLFEQLRKNTEVYLRAKLLIHDRKPKTGNWKRERLKLSLSHAVHSTQFLIVLVLVFIVASIILSIYYDFKYPEDGRFFRNFSLFTRRHW